MTRTLALVAGLLSSLVVPARAQPEAAPRCQRDRAGTPLVLVLKAPAKAHGIAVRNLLAARFPCVTFVCKDKAGTMYAVIADADAKALFGKHLAVRTVPNAGGSAGKDAVFVDITPKGYVPTELRPHVKALWFDTDPTFWLGDDPDQRACEATPAPPRHRGGQR